eukprot:gb/GECG01000841.1/.p1 GENE.gb/GECG01000841.1/~~gb/GECG01000841.1/.p1  ORF type:complete len:872 (+),score=75.69 gb/GECG01000841.1/:1-2616(+)
MEEYLRIRDRRPPYPPLDGAPLLLRKILRTSLYHEGETSTLTTGAASGQNGHNAVRAAGTNDTDFLFEEEEDDDSSSTEGEQEGDQEMLSDSTVSLNVTNICEAVKQTMNGVWEYPESWDAFALLAERFHRIGEYESKHDNRIARKISILLLSRLESNFNEQMDASCSVSYRRWALVNFAGQLYVRSVFTTEDMSTLLDMLLESSERDRGYPNDYLDYVVQLLASILPPYTKNNPQGTETVLRRVKERSDEISSETYCQHSEMLKEVDVANLLLRQSCESAVPYGNNPKDVLKTYLCWLQTHSEVKKLEDVALYWMNVESHGCVRSRSRHIEAIPWKHIQRSVVCRLEWPSLLYVGEHPFELALLQQRLPNYCGGLGVRDAQIDRIGTSSDRHIVDFSYLSRISSLSLLCESRVGNRRRFHNLDNAFYHLNNLKRLDLLCSSHDGANNISGYLFRYLPQLRELQLSPERSDFTATSFRFLTNLTSLDLNARFREDLCNKEGFAYLSHIKDLKLRRVPQGRALAELLSQLPNLTSIDLRDDEVHPLQPVSFARMSGNLRRLRIHLQDVEDEWFENLSNVTYLDIRKSSARLTSEAFRHLPSLSCLHMEGCSRTAIGDRAFEHLPQLKELNIGRCNQPTITDEAFAHLPSMTKVRMDGCKQTTITDNAFVHLKRIVELNVSDCGNITNGAFQHCTNLKELDITACHQKHITDEAFKCLRAVKRMRMGGCHSTSITDQAFRHLSNMTNLYMSECNQTTITDEAFRHLGGVQCLVMNSCYQTTITDEAFRHLSSVTELHMQWCRQLTITDAAFKHLSNVEILDVERCDQTTITGEAFQHLPRVQMLNLRMCRIMTSLRGSNSCMALHLPDVDIYY